jgi:hypothetical protein
MSPMGKNLGKQREQQTSHMHSENTAIGHRLTGTLGVNCFHSSELTATVRKTRSQ